MSTKQKAVVEIREFARSVKGILALADELERIGSVEAAAKEADARYEKACAAVAAADKELATYQQASVEARESAQKNLHNAKLLADQALENAKKVAAELKAKAQADADEIVDGAMKRKADIDALAEQRQRQADALAATIKTRSETLAELDGQLARIRKQVGG